MVAPLTVGCPRTTNNGDLTAEQSPLLAALAEVEEALGAHRWAEALLLADGLKARYPDDPFVAALELLKGRAHLGAENPSQALASFRVAEVLSCPDPLVGVAAVHYKALAVLQQDGLQAALKTPAKIPTPSRWLNPPDQAPLWWLVAEQHSAQGEPIAAVNDLGEALQASGDPIFSAFVKGRAFDLAATLPLPDPTVATNPLAMAALTYAHVLQRLRVPDADLSAVQGMVAQAGPAFQAIGEQARADELVQRLSQPPVSGRLIVGAILPLTGQNRRVARMVMAGLLQAQRVFVPGNTPHVTLVFEDCGSDPAKAAAAVGRLSELGALAIIGPLDADAAHAAAQAASPLQIPLITLTLDPSVTAQGAHVLRVAPDPSTEAEALVRHLQTLADTQDAQGSMRVLVLQPSLPYSDAMTQALSQKLASLGVGEITEVIHYPNDAPDLRDTAKEVEKRDFDAIFIPDTAERASLVASFLAQQNVWARPSAALPKPGKGEARRFVWLLGTSLWYQEDFSTLRYLENSFFAVAFAPGAGGLEGEAFAREFEQIYGRAPGLYDALGFDVMRWLRGLLEGGASSKGAVLNNLRRPGEAFDGVLGSLVFEDGSASPSFRLVQIQGKRPSFVTPAVPVLPGGAP